MTSQSKFCFCSHTATAPSACALLLSQHWQEPSTPDTLSRSTSFHLGRYRTSTLQTGLHSKGQRGYKYFLIFKELWTYRKDNLVTAYTFSDLSEQPNFETFPWLKWDWYSVLDALNRIKDTHVHLPHMKKIFSFTHVRECEEKITIFSGNCNGNKLPSISAHRLQGLANDYAEN